jgi:cytochrome c nitrite reductase small subunit
MNALKSKKRRLGVYLLIGIPLLVLIGFATSKSAIDYTSKPSFCGSCHLMQTRYVSWERSLHNGATCFQCHSEPGLVGEVQAKLNGIKYLYYEYEGYRDVQILRAEVSNASCMRCHTIEEMDEKMQRAISPIQNPPTSHSSHVKDLNISCTACHGNIMHVTLEGTSKKALGACKDCHKQTDFVNLINRLIF